MKVRATSWIGAALACAMIVGAPVVWAANGTLPAMQHRGEIAWVSGGIGSDQSAAFKAAMPQYPLSLEFARHSAAGNEYLANVPVKIADSSGTPLLDTRSRGPFMLVSIPAGRYVISARHDGQTERRAVDIGKHTGSTPRAHETFVWPT